MAPRKIKGDTGTGTEDATMILNYLREQKFDANDVLMPKTRIALTSTMFSRPYSAIQISANLHNKISKAQAAKLLRELHQDGDIEERIAGKQAVYHALQDPSHSVILEVIATRIREIEKLQEELTTIKTNEKKARATLSTFQAKPRLSDLRQDIQQLETERSAIQARLTSHQGDDEVGLPAEEREKLEREWKIWQRHATLRHRICRELWGKCTEVLPENMTSKEFWESLGLEGTLQ